MEEKWGRERPLGGTQTSTELLGAGPGKQARSAERRKIGKERRATEARDGDWGEIRKPILGML